MGSQRKRSDLPPTPPGHPPPSMATGEASSSSGRSNQERRRVLERSNQPADSTQPASFNPQPPSRRKKPGASKNLISEEETQKKYSNFHSVFESFSPEKKKSDFLEIRIQELRDYLKTSFKNDSKLVLQTFDEAIEFGKTTQNENETNWGFWACPQSHCNKKFTDGENHVDHFLTQHGKQKKLAREVCPPPARWIDMVNNKAWKPVDVSEALQTIEDNHHLSDDDIVNLELPLSHDDNERAALLERIRNKLKLILRTESFPESNLTRMMGLIREDLKLVFPKSKHEAIERIARLGLCIMFLDAPQLNDLLVYFGILVGDCNTLLFPDKDGSLDLNFKKLKGKITIQEKIEFSEDGSCLVLEERLLTLSAIVPRRYLLQNASVSGFSTDDAFVDWLLCSASLREEMGLWARLKSEISILGSTFLTSSDLAWKSMYSWAQESMKLLEEEKELQLVEVSCAQEDALRIQEPESDDLDYESLISWLPDQNPVRVETVKAILHDAKTLVVAEEFGTQKPWAWMRKWLDDINSDNEFRRQDASIRIALHRRINSTALQQCRVDSKSLTMKRLKRAIGVEFQQACGLDYRAILLPFVKSFLQDKIEKLIRQDAEQKADDAAAKLIKELEREEKNKKKDPPAMGKPQKKPKSKKGK